MASPEFSGILKGLGIFSAVVGILLGIGAFALAIETGKACFKSLE